MTAFTSVVSLDYSIADELGYTASAKITATIDPLARMARPTPRMPAWDAGDAVAAVGGVVKISILLLVGGALLLVVRGLRRGRRYA